ncbi:serine hydrolase domain-containing protein [Wenyingzhuangia sp. IMCC45574]
MKKICLLLSFLTFQLLISQELDSKKLDQFFNTLEENNQFMGSVSVSKEGKTIYEKSIGFSDLSNDVKNNAKTTYKIGSVSKTFTSVLTFLAIEKKLLSLDTKLDSFLPEIENSSKITIAHLLYHRSGIANYTGKPLYRKWDRTQPKTQKEVLDLIVDSGSDFAPDTKFKYSNSNYYVLSYILESVFDLPYGKILEKYITKPLHLTQTYYDKEPNSKSYLYLNNWLGQKTTHSSIPMGAGAIVSTPSDLNLFIEGLFHEKLITKESLEKMTTLKGRVGMGIFRIPFKNKVSLGHNGRINGYRSIVSYFPKEKLALAIISNGERNNINDIGITILKAVFNEKYQLPDFKNYGDVSQLLGTYSSKQLPLKMTIAINAKKQLTAQATGQSSFVLDKTIKPNIFKFETAGIQINFNPKKKQFILIQGKRYLFTKEE